ncbi:MULTISPECIES: hypothetical protein [unclassified Streptomyces]|uniref:Uncharacterized protein n=1 Tax=Streptomyces evansiae TaxID=3075535 RepID=A0ABU2R275_9ACTN|nr:MULTISPECIES: hypothetical protein [unclassified Streptomyces]MDT0410792.1 hypothetical protein [Streptomyces sp. DSM 41979]MYQ61322.1 hypothetical protein [Streptomyces sp. SID4926]MYR29486.1 hypothetical protein [Streptomyces sp. SID4945]SCD71178.1 hypothetical protein GA0115251_119942 [Streptomyces sp. TverLS-915]SCE22922.1 hypothetical protein GA0115252_13636 [Streptomyces sp. DfronAA-171]
MPETSLDEGQAAAVSVPPLPVPSHRAECPGVAVPAPRPPSAATTPAPARPTPHAPGRVPAEPDAPAPEEKPEAVTQGHRTPTGNEVGCLFALSQPPLMIFLTVVGLLLLMGAVHDLYLS